MTNIIELETSRLKLRQWRAEDKPVFAGINSDPSVMEFYPRVLETTESNSLADYFNTLIAEKGWGFWAVEKKVDCTFIGFVGLNEPTYDLPVTPCVEIGWRLARNEWGYGYASEAAEVAMQVAFTHIDLPEIYSFASVTNTKSIAVMERLGMQNTNGNFEHPIIPENHSLREHVLYKIDNNKWLERNV
jgi:RimJ/RimL family protein N-acetyltransferase